MQKPFDEYFTCDAPITEFPKLMLRMLEVKVFRYCGCNIVVNKDCRVYFYGDVKKCEK